MWVLPMGWCLEITNIRSGRPRTITGVDMMPAQVSDRTQCLSCNIRSLFCAVVPGGLRSATQSGAEAEGWIASNAYTLFWFVATKTTGRVETLAPIFASET